MHKGILQEIINSQTAMLLIASNMVVFIVALFSSLSIVHLLLIYWIEVFVILFFAILKIVVAKIFFGYKKYSYPAILLSIIIIGGIYLFYLPFIIVLSVPFGVAISYDKILQTLFPTGLILIGFSISAIILFISHLVSFLVHFKQSVDISEKAAGKQITSRMFVFHISLVFGIFLGFFFRGFGARSTYFIYYF